MLLAGISPTSGPEVVLVPMLLIGLGIGTLASQLGAVTVSAVPDEKAPQVGGLQNTMTNLGASLGTALAGSIMIAVLTSSFLSAIAGDPAIPSRVSSNAQVTLASGVPFISDQQLEAALDDANVPPRQADAAMDHYRSARIDGLESALAILALRDGARALRHPAPAAHSARRRGGGGRRGAAHAGGGAPFPGLSKCSVDRIATEWRTLVARDH